MLILTRRQGETVAIGRHIRVHVLGIKGTQVRLGIEAPAEVAIHREEFRQGIGTGSDRKTKRNNG